MESNTVRGTHYIRITFDDMTAEQIIGVYNMSKTDKSQWFMKVKAYAISEIPTQKFKGFSCDDLAELRLLLLRGFKVVACDEMPPLGNIITLYLEKDTLRLNFTMRRP